MACTALEATRVVSIQIVCLVTMVEIRLVLAVVMLSRPVESARTSSEGRTANRVLPGTTNLKVLNKESHLRELVALISQRREESVNLL